MTPIRLSPAAKDALQTYSFPGNVRELENILERASTLCDNNTIQPDDLQLQTALLDTPTTTIKPTTTTFSNNPTPKIIDDDVGVTELGPWNPADEEAERALIIKALEQTRWNRTRAAEILGMTFRQLRYRIQKYGLDEG